MASKLRYSQNHRDSSELANNDSIRSETKIFERDYTQNNYRSGRDIAMQLSMEVYVISYISVYCQPIKG